MPIGWILKPVAVVSTIAVSTLGILSRWYQRPRLYFNLTVYFATVGVASVWGVLLSLFATAAGQRLNIQYYVAHSFYRMCHPIVGIDFEVKGEEHLDALMTARDGKPQSAVCIGNHQSLLDLLYIGRIFPQQTTIMAKQELKWTPLLGQFMTLSGAVFINRKNRKDAVATVAKAGEDMKRHGVNLWIFAEGTRHLKPEPSLLPFKKGAFHLAVQAQVPIVPVVCENYYHLFDGRSRFDPGILKIQILPPISTKGMTVEDVNRLTETTREAMLAALEELSSSPKPPQVPEIESAKSTAVDGTQPDAIRQRVLAAESTGTSSSSLLGSRGEITTEDEMDDDAVLLKHPVGI